jgi:hypothetical protein
MVNLLLEWGLHDTCSNTVTRFHRSPMSMIDRRFIHSPFKFNTPRCKAFSENSKFVGVLADPAIKHGVAEVAWRSGWAVHSSNLFIPG